MVFPEKFIRSKCPNCKKNGIEFWKTGSRYNPKLTCRYCKKVYKVSWSVSFVFTIVCACTMGAVLALIREHVFKIPVWLCYIIILIPFLIFEYFAPLKEVASTKDTSTEETNNEEMNTGDGSVS